MFNLNLLAAANDETANALIPNLQDEGFMVSRKSAVEDCFASLAITPPHLLILDMMIEKGTGYSLVNQIKSKFNGPIMVLTSKEDDMEHILSLTLGADDYVPKHINHKVLVARIRALLRRTYQNDTGPTDGTLTIGSLVIDPRRREVSFDNRLIELTTFEFDLLHFFAVRAGSVVSRDEIYRYFYNSLHNGVARSIDMYISRIRKKLGDDPFRPNLLKTVRGSGYLLMNISVTNSDKTGTK